MNLLEQLTKVYKNLASLGQAKLAMLAGAAIVSIGLVLRRRDPREQAVLPLS